MQNDITTESQSCNLEYTSETHQSSSRLSTSYRQVLYQIQNNRALLVYDPVMPTKRGNIPTCYASCSIGHKPEHNLPAKLKAISDAGFDAIELSMPDLLTFASDNLGKEVGPKDFEDLCEAGQGVGKLCQEHKLKILILQPFSNFEGWPKASKERDDAFERARGWIRIMESVGTDMLQVSKKRHCQPERVISARLLDDVLSNVGRIV